MKQILHIALFLAFIPQLLAQSTIDPVAHPKFQNTVPSPTKINVGAATTTMQMAQTTQWLGLVSPTNAPLQTTVWGYGLNGGAVSYPGPTLVANSYTPANVEWRNNLPTTHLLPIDQTYHQAMPTAGVPTVVHLHGAHAEDASDGQPEAWYTTGYAQKGIQWTKPVYTYDNTQEGSNLWYHDHALGMTRLNVYAGLSGFYRLNDANDQALSLPRGNYDRELMVQDRMFDATGKLFLPTDPAVANGGLPEFFGDFILVNGMVWPFMNVEARKYRFRLVNGSDSRVYIFSLSNNAAFLQIGSDGGKFNTPKSTTNLNLAPGERADIIVDFSTMNGQQITLLNTGTDQPFGNPASVQADPATTGQIMQFRVSLPLNTAIPDVNITTTTNLRPQLGAIQALGVPNKTRQLALFEGADELGRILPMLGIVDPTSHHNGSLLWHDHTTEIVNLNDTETWQIYNTTADAHPVHLHLVSFQILNKQTFTGTLTPKPQVMHNGGVGEGATLSNILLTGVPTTYAPNDLGWKDTHILLPGEMMTIKARFDRAGEYVWHCHILSHEDHDMMRKLVVSNNVPCVGDVTPPVLTACPTNLNLTTTGTTAIAPHWVEPTATDNCSTPSVSFTTSPTTGLMHGGAFPIGTTTVNYKAIDANGNSSTCSFTVTVTNANAGGNVCTTPAANIIASANAITVSGITTSAAIIQVLNSSFSTVYNQQVSTTTAIVPNLPTGSYTVNVTVLNTGGVWPAVCKVQQVVTVGGGTNACTNDVQPPVLTACPTNIALTTTGTTALAPHWVEPTATDNCSTPSVSYATSPTVGLVHGGAFPIGTTTITYKATDAKNNAATCSFTLTVTSTTACANDIVPPSLTPCPANLNLTATGTTAIASWTAPTATDNCTTPTVTFATSPTVGLINGGAFPIGTTTVTYRATDAKGNATTCSFNVVVSAQVGGSNICTSPAANVVSGSNSITVSGMTTASGIIQILNSSFTTVYNQQVSTSSTTIPALPAGDYIVNVTVLNAGGIWPAVCMVQQKVTVTTGANPCATDVTPPVLTACPANLNLTTTGTTAVATWTAPTATDNCSTPSVNFTTSPTTNLTNGGAFPIGTTTVTYKATDAKNNTATCAFTVIVTQQVVNPCATDVIPPVLTACPANIALTTTGTTAIATWTAPTATDNCSTPSVTFTTSPTANLTNGGAFPIGTTTVTYKAIDAKNNVATCAFTVIVTNPCATDVTPPVLTACPANIALTTTGTTAYAAWTAPTATDNCSTPSVAFTTSPTANLTSGVAFPIGTTTVTYKATDAKNNTATCAFTVIVTQQVVNPCANDVTPPVFTYCPTTVNVPVGILSICKPGTWTKPTATDNCSNPTILQTYGPVSGTCFYPNTYAITYTALDAKGNKSTCNFTVNAYKTLGLFLQSNENLVMVASAESKRVQIEWLNNTGYKNDFFTIEKINPTTGQFEALAIKNSESTDTTQTNYVTFDELPFEGDNTYRVKVTFKDGTYKYSAEQTVQYTGTLDVHIFPNPANDPVNIDLRQYKNQAVNVSMYNSIGQLVLSQKVEKVVNNILELSIGNLSIGTYRIRIESKGRRDVLKALVIAR